MLTFTIYRHAVEAFAAHMEVIDFDADAAAHAGEIRADLEKRDSA